MRHFVLFAISCLFFLRSVAGSGNAAPPELIFKENKGQWQNNILYKGEIKNGAIFFEKNCITFNLIDGRDILRIKGDHHKLENYVPVIDYTLHLHAFKMKFSGASDESDAKGNDAIKEYFSYFIGNDRKKWASAVQAFHVLDYHSLYPGIDLKITSQDRMLKYIYEVKPGTETSKLKVDFEGTDGLSINNDGGLVIKTSVGDIVDMKPYAYQVINGVETEVPCEFTLKGNTVNYHFLKGYDNSKSLFIDPTLIFSTYSGSTVDNFGYSATYDSKGNAFGAGSVFGIGYPVTTGAYQMNYVGGPIITFTGGGTYPGDDISITKYSADGTQRIFSTYLGGYGQDLPHSLIVNSKDELYILGTTSCSNYPTTATAYDTSYNGGSDPGVFDGIAADYKNGSDIVISRLSVDGTQLLSSTYVGGNGNDGLNYTAGQSYSAPGFLRHNYADEVRGEIEIDKNNNVYVASTTNSADFPRTAGTLQSIPGGGLDACIFKMDADLTTMIWSTTFGGQDDDAAYSVAIDRNENLFVAGGTRSYDFPIRGQTIQNSFAGGEADGFITHISKDGSSIIASTFYGYQDYDQIYFVDLDKQNNVYVLGQADSSRSNFIYNAAYSKPGGGQFITKFNEALDTIIWSTTFGRGLEKTDISPTAFLVDVCSNIYACGWGSQSINSYVGGTGSGTLGLFTTTNAYKRNTDGQDFYLMVMKDDASAITYATFMGGSVSEEHVDGGTSRFDKKGVVYESACAGCGAHSDFPTTTGAVSTTNNSNNCNNAVFKFDLNLPIVVADFTAPSGCRNIPVPFNNDSRIVSVPTYQWTFGDGSSSTQNNPTHAYTQNGLYTVTLVITDTGSCNLTDTFSKTVLIIGGVGNDTLPSISLCRGQNTQIGIPPINDTSVTYHWTPFNTLSSSTTSNPFASPLQTTTYQLLVNNGACVDTFHQTVIIASDSLHIATTTGACQGDTILVSLASVNGTSFINYTWTPASLIVAGAHTANPLVVTNKDTTLYVTVETPQHCLFRDSVRVHLSGNTSVVKANFNTPPAGCVPDTALFVNTSTGGNGNTYEWHFDDGTTSTLDDASHIYNSSGFYNITLIARNSATCNKVDSITKRIAVLGNTSYSLAPTTICFSDTAQIGFQVFDSSLTYNWTPTGSLNNAHLPNPLAHPADTTTYVVVISNGACNDTVRQTVNVFKDSIYATGDTVLCPGQPVHLLVGMRDTSQHPVYNWSPDRLILSGDSTTSPLVTVNQSTTFIVTAENALHCRYVDSARVSVFANLPNVIATATPDTIAPGKSSQLNSDSTNAIWLMWQQDSTLSATDITNPVATPHSGDHSYIVEVRDEHGCYKRDTVTVYVQPTPCASSNFYIPNAFTPNGDGKNDVLYVRGNDITAIYFAIYDRWGQKMFETKDMNKGWDGTFKGKKLDAAVFGYYVEVTCIKGDKFTKKGNITLLR